MKTIKVRALILREYEAGESDKRLLLLCKKYGKIMAYARGARKPKSKFMAAAQMFTYADFVLAKGKGFYSLTQADVIESFYPLRQDYDRLLAACYMADICKKTLWENINSDELLKLMLRSLKHLTKGILPPTQIVNVFLFRFFDVHGFQPQLDECTICNCSVDEISGGIYLHSEGLACKSHNIISHHVSAGALAAMQHIQKSDLRLSFMFNTTDVILKELTQAANLMLNSHFEIKL